MHEMPGAEKKAATSTSRDPAPGQHPTDVTVTFDVVKDGETCP